MAIGARRSLADFHSAASSKNDTLISSSPCLVERAQAMGGTLTGEHGIGQGKQKYLKAELGVEAIDAMRAEAGVRPAEYFQSGEDRAGGAGRVLINQPVDVAPKTDIAG